MSVTPSDPVTQQVPVDPFTITFDYTDNYCAWPTDSALDDITDTALLERVAEKAGVHVTDPDRVRDLLLAEASELKHRVSDLEDDPGAGDELEAAQTLLEQVEEAARRLTWCDGGCDCAYRAFDAHKSGIDTALASLGRQHWAVIEDDYPHEDQFLIDIHGTLTLEQLGFLAPRVEWSQLSVQWDGTMLKVDLSGDRGGLDAQLTPLNAEQRKLAARWYELVGSPNNLAARVLREDNVAIRAALDLYLALGPVRRSVDLDDFITAYAALPAVDHAAVDPAVVAALVEDWAGTITELLSSVVAATTDQVA